MHRQPPTPLTIALLFPTWYEKDLGKREKWISAVASSQVPSSPGSSQLGEEPGWLPITGWPNPF